MSGTHASIIATELKLQSAQVERTLALFKEGATMPFIARYRKEVTGNLDEVQLSAIQERSLYLEELDARKETVLKEIESQGKLVPELKQRIVTTLSKTELEDLYLPYKPKRRTRATIARERGLEPLAERILRQAAEEPSREELARAFVDPAKEVPDVEAAFAGARDIVAEQVAERADVRAALRDHALETGELASSVIAGKEEEGSKFKDYFNLRERVQGIPSHRLLALRRGEKEGFLRVALEVDGSRATDLVRQRVVILPKAALARELELAMADSYERLLASSIEVDVRLVLKDKADLEAIRVFAENLRNLLLQAPLGGQRVLGVDPGYRTGCKVVVVNEQGELKANDVIYPSQSERKIEEAEAIVVGLCKQHRIEAVAVGNGTAGRETETWIRKLAKEGKLGELKIIVVNEAGASVYSASEVAREELPDHDVTVRGSVSIARRLQDPLAELVKIDPKAIGVGQYQHDVNQRTLARSLDATVEDCVNAVGVDVNTASAPLLERVSGLNKVLAKNIVEYRDANGPFPNRTTIRKVPRLGDKTFEQAAGFLRINDGDNPLDRSSVHPEAYSVVERILARISKGIVDVMGQPAALKGLSPADFTDEKFGVPTVRDILTELEKPGRDPRPEFKTATFQEGIESLTDLKGGMILEGVVTNVAAFGAFVDVGVHQDGLVHVSSLANKFIKDPHEVVKPGQIVKVKVLDVDVKRQRISLTMRLDDAPISASASSRAPVEISARVAREPHDRRPPAPQHAPERQTQPGGMMAMALALARAKQKK